MSKENDWLFSWQEYNISCWNGSSAVCAVEVAIRVFLFANGADGIYEFDCRCRITGCWTKTVNVVEQWVEAAAAAVVVVAKRYSTQLVVQVIRIILCDIERASSRLTDGELCTTGDCCVLSCWNVEHCWDEMTDDKYC